MTEPRIGIYPASFNPPTVAHLAISEAAREQRQLDQVIWSISSVALGKEHLSSSSVESRLSVLEEVAAKVGWLSIQLTDQQLLADIAQGFDVLILGADKWHQIQELQWYESEEERAEALARLPELAIAPRPPDWVPEDLEIQVPGMSHVSSTAARAGEPGHMLPEAETSGLW